MHADVCTFHLRCPGCVTLLVRASVADADHLDPTLWTDGARHEALAATAPEVWMCPHCRRAFHAVAPPEPSIERPHATPPPARVREAEGVELARALARGLARSRSEERRLRLQCWWRLNDSTREALVAHTLEPAKWVAGPALRANLRALRPLLDFAGDRLTLAEVARELGDFERSAELLEPALPEDPLAQLLRMLVERRVSAPAQLRLAIG